LIIQELASGRTSELLTHPLFLWAPAFSPDGRELAFSRAETDGAWHIWITPVAGGTPRRLTSGAVPEVYPRFSPDGASIIYHTWTTAAGRIWRVPRAGGPAVALTPQRNEDSSYGDISPDGRRLAFARTENDTTRIYIAPVGGGEARRLTEGASTLPRWSPDGQWIAFSPNRGFTGGIFVIRSDGSGARRVSETGSFPVWWSDGKRLAYLDLGPEGVQQILIRPVAGGPPKPLGSIRFKGANNPFDISPDGRLLASSSVINVSSEIWRLEAPGPPPEKKQR
jgi:TolB protein